MITTPDGDIAEDRIVTAVGSYSASATLNGAGTWIMQMVAFKAAGGGAGHDTADGAVGSGGDGQRQQRDQSELDGVDRQRRGDRVPGGALPGCGVQRPLRRWGRRPGPTFADTGLLASTSYSYRVRATDAAGNLSGVLERRECDDAGARHDSRRRPQAGLTATAVSTSQINLSWTASTDNVGVTGYRVYRCQQTGAAADCPNFVKVIQQAGPATTFSDATGLLPGTTYRYIVQAVDDAGNLSAAIQRGERHDGGGEHRAWSPPIPSTKGRGTTVVDLSGNGNHGTIANAAWTTAGKYGKALAFNGTNAAVTINDSASLKLTSAMTLEAWVNPSTVTSAWRDVIYKGNDNYYLEGTSNNGGVIRRRWHVCRCQREPVWHRQHCRPTRGRTLRQRTTAPHLRLYLNGTLVSSQARTGAIATSTNPLQIGGDSIYGQFFQGAIDEVRIYNRALAQAEIQADMSAPLGISIIPPTNLMATVVSGNQVNLSWSAAQSTLGISNYRVERCQAIGCANFALHRNRADDDVQRHDRHRRTLRSGIACRRSIRGATQARTRTWPTLLPGSRSSPRTRR